MRVRINVHNTVIQMQNFGTYHMHKPTTLIFFYNLFSYAHSSMHLRLLSMSTDSKDCQWDLFKIVRDNMSDCSEDTLKIL